MLIDEVIMFIANEEKFWANNPQKYIHIYIYIYIYSFLSDEGPMLETLDYTIRIGSTPTFYISICIQ